jgi:hypothetical protein
MTVRIYYSKPCEMICEVSDDFNVLTAEIWGMGLSLWRMLK